MENLIIIVSMLLNIALIIALAVYIKKYNQEQEHRTITFNEYESEHNKLLKKMQELSDSRSLNSEINKKLLESLTSKEELIQKCDRQNAKIKSLQSINSTILNDNRKLSDELQEIKNKPFDPLKELDNLTIRKEETKTPEAKPEKKTNKKETEKESARH